MAGGSSSARTLLTTDGCIVAPHPDRWRERKPTVKTGCNLMLHATSISTL